MQGFTDRALILFSDINKYYDATSEWRTRYQQSLDNLVARLTLDNIQPCVLYTDALALVLKHNAKVYATSDPSDMFFMKTHGMPELDTVPLAKDIVDSIRKKYPIDKGITTEARGYIVEHKTAMAEREIIKSFKLIFVFGSLYKPKTKPGDDRAVITISQQFIPFLKLSGYDAQVGAFLQYPGATSPMYDWSVT